MKGETSMAGLRREETGSHDVHDDHDEDDDHEDHDHDDDHDDHDNDDENYNGEDDSDGPVMIITIMMMKPRRSTVYRSLS